MKNYTFKKPRWTIGVDGTIRYKCNDAVYGWITKIPQGFKWKAAMIINFGNGDGISKNLKSAKKCIELLINGTKSSLYLQTSTKGNKKL